MRKKTKYNIVSINGYTFVVTEDGYKCVCELQNKIDELKNSKNKLEAELAAIKPIIKDERYKPAMSKGCGDCEYCVRSPWNNEIIGCRKDNVCEDFKKR